MQMFATLDGLNNSADIGAVFNNGVANIEILKSNLMADRNIIKSCDLNIRITIHDPAVKLVSLFDSFNHDDTNGIAGLVYDEMSCHFVLLN